VVRLKSVTTLRDKVLAIKVVLSITICKPK